MHSKIEEAVNGLATLAILAVIALVIGVWIVGALNPSPQPVSWQDACRGSGDMVIGTSCVGGP